MAKKPAIGTRSGKSSATELVQKLVAAGLDEKIAMKDALAQFGYTTIVPAWGRYAH